MLYCIRLIAEQFSIGGDNILAESTKTFFFDKLTHEMKNNCIFKIKISSLNQKQIIV